MAPDTNINPVDLADSALIERVQAGDTEAFEPIVRRHLPLIRAFVALRIPSLADEITHETFVFAFRRIKEFDRTRPLRPWLRTIAWNLIRAELQRFAREQANLSRLEQAQLAGLHRGMPNDNSPSDEAGFLEECLRDLSPDMRHLVEERYRRGLSTEELATACGRTLEWVRITLFRVRKRLRTCIEGKIAGSQHVS